MNDKYLHKRASLQINAENSRTYQKGKKHREKNKYNVLRNAVTSFFFLFINNNK